jgi:hypothetical protein
LYCPLHWKWGCVNGGGVIVLVWRHTICVFIFRNFMDIPKQNVLIQKPAPGTISLCF